MTEEVTDVKQEGSDASTETSEKEVAPVKEDVQNPISQEKDYKGLYENASKALVEKNRKIQELKSLKSSSDQDGADEEGVRRFLEAETNAYIAKQFVTDPLFKELYPQIEQKMAEGFSVKDAETAIKAQLAEEMFRNVQEEQKTVQIPKQITPGAEREPVKKEQTLQETDPLLADAIMRAGIH